MLQTVLLGSDASAPRPKGVLPFIRSVLRYRALIFWIAATLAMYVFFNHFGWVIPSGLAFVALEVYACLLLARVVADLLQFEDWVRALVAMWLPLLGIVVAAYLFFVNDQGRELGVGLIDPSVKQVSLGLALIFWAWNNWLAARNGLERKFPPPREAAPLFWGPRVVGVCAHLLAAFSLSVAAWRQPALREAPGVWLVAASPVAIILATAFAWQVDTAYLSRRAESLARAKARTWLLALGVLETALVSSLVYEIVAGQQKGLAYAALAITGSALIFLITISIIRQAAPLSGDPTQQEKDQDEVKERRLTVRHTVVLAVILLVATLAIWIWPIRVGQIAGSLTLACFSFGAILAVVNAIDLCVVLLIAYAASQGFTIWRRAAWAASLCFLGCCIFLASWTHPFHRVRICKDNECTPAAAPWAALKSPKDRPTVSEAARDWYAQAEPAYHELHPGEPVPMLIVATAGGGIRAAYWTATVLEQLDKDLQWDRLAHPAPPDRQGQSLLRNLLFAISGVSGGSVGAAAYAAAVHDHEVHPSVAVAPTCFLREDFLAPGLAGLVFIDGPANLLPAFGQMDRAEALERGFEGASATENDKDGLLSHAFLSFFPTRAEVQKSNFWRPALLLNATHMETGRRIIASHIKIERNIFLDSYDALQILEQDLRLSTAAHNSARFTYVSPAGEMSSASKPDINNGYVIDGGYFENYGAKTALELARNAIDTINKHDPKGNKVRPVFLLISSDPSLQPNRTLVRVTPADKTRGCAVSTFGNGGSDNFLDLTRKDGEREHVVSYFNELRAPFTGIMSAREAHATLAAEELAAESCSGDANLMKLDTVASTPAPGDSKPAPGDFMPAMKGDDAPHFSHLAMCETSANGGEGVNPPLGWVLSSRTRDRIATILGDCGNDHEFEALKQALTGSTGVKDSRLR